MGSGLKSIMSISEVVTESISLMSGTPLIVLPTF